MLLHCRKQCIGSLMMARSLLSRTRIIFYLECHQRTSLQSTFNAVFPLYPTGMTSKYCLLVALLYFLLIIHLSTNAPLRNTRCQLQVSGR